MADPKSGQMYLFDEVTPPLLDNSYYLDIETHVSKAYLDDKLETQVYFDVEGPRFQLAATEVAGVFPPRNGHGDFSNVIPHIVLKRRTLPWERALAAGANLPEVTPDNVLAPPNRINGDKFVPPPWLALLLFEEGEAEIVQSTPLTPDVIPESVLQALGLNTPNTGITCDLVVTNSYLLAAMMPSLYEITLLCHARQVNVDDRELNVSGGDGWFSVVMSNRLPNPGAKCLACLVSLEQRTDIVFGDPPPVAGSQTALAKRAGAIAALTPTPGVRAGARATTTVSGGGGLSLGIGPGVSPNIIEPVWLILLHSWRFECTGTGTFRQLMQNLDVGMFGVITNPGHPPVADTGHVQLQLQDRSGSQETVWYRGPLSPHQLTRDPLGPYHSADQALRVSPETGALDISYAAAFEAGRLIAAADGRLAQELMRWRREAYRVSALSDSLTVVEKAFSAAGNLDAQKPASPLIAPPATNQYIQNAGPLGDPYGIEVASRTIGFDGSALQQAWGLSSQQQALNLLGADPGVLGTAVAAPAQTARNNTTIDSVAADTTGLDALSNARNLTVNNLRTQAGGG